MHWSRASTPSTPFTVSWKVREPSPVSGSGAVKRGSTAAGLDRVTGGPSSWLQEKVAVFLSKPTELAPLNVTLSASATFRSGPAEDAAAPPW